MAATITRTPMIDDDGTGQTGTILNNSWKQELYGQIDAALASVATSAVGPIVPWTPTITGNAGGSGQVYSGREGISIKLGGNSVFLAASITLSAKGTFGTSVTVAIGGLPLAAYSGP